MGNGGAASWLTGNAKKNACGRENGCKTGSAACSERTGSDNVRIESFVDREMKSSLRLGNGEVARDEKGVGTAEPGRGAKKTPEGMRLVRIRGKRGERKAERVDGGAKMEARENDLSCVPRMAAAEKLNSVAKKLKKVKKDHYNLIRSLQLTQMELERVRGGWKEKNVLIESFREAAKTRNPGGGKQRKPRKVTRCRRYEICGQECLYGFAQVLYDRVLDYAKWETSELCFAWESVTRSWK